MSLRLHWVVLLFLAGSFYELVGISQLSRHFADLGWSLSPLGA